MLIKVAGTASGQKAFLTASRKPEGGIRKWEYEHRNQAGQLTEYRKNLTKSTLNDCVLNRISIKKFSNENGDSYPITLYITHPSGSHLLNLGSGSIGRNAVNTLLSLLNNTNIEGHKFSISVYNKEDRNKVAVSVNGERTEWYVPKEEKDKLVTVTDYKGKKLVDDSKFVELLMSHADKLNPLLPQWAGASSDGLDGFFDDVPDGDEPTQSSIDDDFPTEEKPKPVSHVVEDIPFN